MNAPTTNVPATRKEMPPIVKLNSQLEERADEFKKALPAHISPEKLQRTVMTAAQNNPDLLSADRQSLITSCMKAAQDGLLPDGREAALVIFKTNSKDAHGNWQSKQLVQYMPMVYGLRKKIVQSGDVVSLQTGLVYRAEMEAGAFLYEVGLEPPIRHRPMLDLPAEELTDDKVVAAYSMAKMKDGTISVEVMRRGEIDKVRETSMTGATRDKKGNQRQSKGPWADWFGEMARKTVMRRHSKTLPMSGDVFVDVEGRDQEVIASATRLLDSVEGSAPVSLPDRDDLDAREQEQHDPETGEILDRNPATGMTEVDEETARALDAGDDGGDWEDDQPGEQGDATPAQAPADSTPSTKTASAEPSGAGEPAPGAAEQAAAAEETARQIDGPLDEPPYLAKVRGLRGSVAAAKTIKAIGNIEAAWLNEVRNTIVDDDALIRSVESDIAAKKRELKQAEG